MTLKQFLDLMIGNTPFTVGTEVGMSWILYYDGENKIVWDASEYNNYSAGYLDTNTALEVKEIGVFDLIEGRVI